MLLLLAIAIAAWRYGGPLRDHLVLLYRQHACLTYTAPPDQVVFTNDGERTANEIAKGMIDVEPGAYRILKSGVHAPAAAGRIPDAYRRLDEVDSFRLVGEFAVIFMHERRSPNGHKALVIVRVGDDHGFIGYHALGHLGAEAITPKIRRLSMGPNTAGLPDQDPTVYLFAGQPDTNDDSHFTIAFEANHKPGIIDGWLEDTDDVKLAIRNVAEK